MNAVFALEVSVSIFALYHNCCTLKTGFFAVKPDTTAVFAMSDTVAMGVIRALQDTGRRVPEDVSVVGYDGIEMGKYFIPRLTTVEQPIHDIARESVAMLMGMLERGEDPRHITVDASLIQRESVGSAAI